MGIARVVIKAVGDEPVLSCIGKGAQCIEGFVVSSGHEQQSGDRDHRVASPIAEPWIPRDDRGRSISIDDVRISSRGQHRDGFPYLRINRLTGGRQRGVDR